MISKQTAYEIWIAYDEIAKGNKIIEDIEEQVRNAEPLNLRDSFGRLRNLQLGVPSGENSQRLFDVHPSLALQVIRAHVAHKEAELAVINERAKIESVAK
jgi:hypothetical protein